VLCGAFQIVLLSFASALSAVGAREPIVLNMRFDRMLIPPAAVLTETLAFGASFLMFPIGHDRLRHRPDHRAAVAARRRRGHLTLAFGAAWPATLIGLWFPSFNLFAAQALRIAFFARPGPHRACRRSRRGAALDRLNPLTGLFESFRHVFLYGTSPVWWHLLYPAATGVLLAVVFIPIYRREQRHFAKLVGDA
jgi:ABC-type polysaccharide/polyol phosphate export permease